MSLAAAAGVALAGCSLAPVTGGKLASEKLNDGVYKGRYRHGPNKAVVMVDIREGKIKEIKLLRLFGSWKGKRAREAVIERIIEKQSTRVDAVTGATNSSNVIMNAVQDAIDKSYAKQ